MSDYDTKHAKGHKKSGSIILGFLIIVRNHVRHTNLKYS